MYLALQCELLYPLSLRVPKSSTIFVSRSSFSFLHPPLRPPRNPTNRIHGTYAVSSEGVAHHSHALFPIDESKVNLLAECEGWGILINICFANEHLSRIERAPPNMIINWNICHNMLDEVGWQGIQFARFVCVRCRVLPNESGHSVTASFSRLSWDNNFEKVQWSGPYIIDETSVMKFSLRCLKVSEVQISGVPYVKMNTVHFKSRRNT